MNPKRNILFGMPPNYGIYKVMEACLKFHGWNVISIVNDGPFRYPSLASRLHTKYRKIILRDRKTKSRLQERLLHHSITSRIEQAGGIDYALFVRGDTYHPETIRLIKNCGNPTLINYQWDGMDRFPEIWNYVGLFDRFFVFDPKDIGNSGYRFLPATNFYFDHDLDKLPAEAEGFYFIGLHQPARADLIARFAAYAGHRQWKLDFDIIWAQKKEHRQIRQHYPANIRLKIHGDTFQANLNRARNARVLVDFLDTVHKGLSFRTFEAIGYRKKLITTNPEVRKYDFYHPDNIFVWDGGNLDGLEAFTTAPYHELPPEIYRKYSFGNWLNYVLDIPPYQKLTLPE